MGVQTFHLYNASGQGIVLSFFVNGVNKTHTINAGTDYAFEADSLSPETRNAIQMGFLVYTAGSAVAVTGGVKAGFPLVYRRNYYPTVKYKVGDLILFNGALWLCQEDVYGQTPIQNAAAWTAFLSDVGGGNHQFDTNNPHQTTAAQVGAIATSEKGASNGVAPLVGGKVPAANLPAGSVANGDTKLAEGTSNEVAASALRLHLDSLNNPHQTTAAQVGAVPAASVGVASGVAPLDGSGLIPAAYLPSSAGGSGLVPVYAVSNNTQRDALVGSLTAGSLVAVLSPAKVWRWSGSAFVDATATSLWTFFVNGKSGPAVTLTTDDIAEANGKYYFTDARLNNSSAFLAVQAASHAQNSDTKLASGTGNEVTAAQLKTHIASTANPHNVTAAQIGALVALLGDPAPKLANALDSSGYRLLNVGTPTLNTDAATKKYVDDLVTASSAGGVVSVNTRAGVVTLVPADVGLDPALSSGDAYYGSAEAAIQGQSAFDATSGPSQALSFAGRRRKRAAITADTAFSFTNLAAGRFIEVLITNAATLRNLTWPGGVNWIGDALATVPSGGAATVRLFSTTGSASGVYLTQGGGASGGGGTGVTDGDKGDIVVTSSGTVWSLDSAITAAIGAKGVKADPLSQFASTTSAQLRGVLSDPTGTGSAVFGIAPSISAGLFDSPRLSTPRFIDTMRTTNNFQAFALLEGTGAGINYITATTNNTAPALDAAGAGTNIDIAINGKGTGRVMTDRMTVGDLVVSGGAFTGGTFTGGSFISPWILGQMRSAAGWKVLSLSSSGTTIVNYLDIVSTATGVGPTLQAVGTDTNIDFTITGKGTGSVVLPKVDINGGTIDGTTITLTSSAYGGGWAADLTPASKKDVYDKIQTLGGGGGGGTAEVYAYFTTGPQVLTTETIISVQCSGGPVNLELPAAASVVGVPIKVQRTLGGTSAPALVAPASGESIEDYFSGLIQIDQGESATFVSDGTVWKLLNNLTRVVRTTGDQQIQDTKTFTTTPFVPYHGYGSDWNGDMSVPTKDAIYDKIETLGGGGGGPAVEVVTNEDGSGGSVQLTNETTVICEAAGGPVQLTLPEIGGGDDEHTITVVRTYGGTGAPALVFPFSGDSIEGHFSGTIQLDPGSSAVFTCDGAKWHVAIDNRRIVRTIGDQQIYDTKTFEDFSPIVPDHAYGSDWNGDFSVPTKNDLWDKIETIGGGGGGGDPLLISRITADTDIRVAVTADLSVNDTDHDGKELRSADDDPFTLEFADADIRDGFSCTIFQDALGILSVTATGGLTVRNADGVVSTGGQWTAISVQRVGNDLIVSAGPPSNGAVLSGIELAGITRLSVAASAYVQLTVSRTATDADNGKILYFAGGSDITLTIPDTLTLPWCCTVEQESTGKVIFAGGGTATIVNRHSHTRTAGQDATVALSYRTGTKVRLTGDGA